jgi:hypothetical protein
VKEKIIVCNCIPNGHRVVTTDAKLIRQVRRDLLASAARWEKEGREEKAVICARYSAHCCLLKLRELKGAA